MDQAPHKTVGPVKASDKNVGAKVGRLPLSTRAFRMRTWIACKFPGTIAIIYFRVRQMLDVKSAPNWYANEEWGSGNTRTVIVEWPNSRLLLVSGDRLTRSIHPSCSPNFHWGQFNKRYARGWVQQLLIPPSFLFFPALTICCLLFLGLYGGFDEDRGSTRYFPP